MNLIKQLRLDLDFTLKELADRSDMGISTVAYIDNGKHIPTDESLGKIAKALYVDKDYLKRNMVRWERCPLCKAAGRIRVDPEEE